MEPRNIRLALVALLLLGTLVLGCRHGSSSFGIFPEEPAGDPSGDPGSSGGGDPDDPGASDPDAGICPVGQAVVCIHEGDGSHQSECVNESDVLSQVQAQGNYEGPCVENELRICHQHPSLPIPYAIWVPANHWLLHQGHTNGKPAPALRYDRMLAPFESCVFGIDY